MAECMLFGFYMPAMTIYLAIIQRIFQFFELVGR